MLLGPLIWFMTSITWQHFHAIKTSDDNSANTILHNFMVSVLLIDFKGLKYCYRTILYKWI